jgi:hypothetical protein
MPYEAQTWSRGVALLILGLDARWESVVIAIPELFYPQERATVPIFEEVGWLLGCGAM